ncbi:BC_2427 family protein [Parageobacillus thermoglucosidasius]|uniref:BC_2427 family protein n=2 Tax=Parageobacillus thermoglucosidasius TaxID=1426 RepID=UPI001F470718|nr:hypothetical protein [Parageobacillus thermoglucosidasius]
MNVFQSSRVQKKPIYPGFPCINKERTKKENDGCESNTAPSRADTVETVNLHENYDIKKMPKLHKKNNVSKRRNVYKTCHMAKRNQTGSTALSPSSPDRDDPEQVFSADGHVLKTDGPSYLQHIPLTDLNHEANNPPSTDPVLKSGYPSSTDERNEPPASENGDETYLLDDTDSLSPLLDETGLEQVSATDDDHLLQADGSSPFQPIFLTNRGQPVKELTADPVLESGYPSSTDERNEPPASENGDETYLLDDTDSLSPLLDETGLEQISATDDDHLLQADGSSPFQPVFLANRGQPVKELTADPVLKSGYPSSTDERNEPPASENGDKTYLLDDTDSLSPLLDETGLEQVSATDDDHLLQADGSSPFQPIFLTNRGQPVKELTADPVLESGYPSSTDERNEPPASENGDETYLLDDTDSLSPLLDETGLEQISATDDDHLLQADGSSPFQPVFLTNRGWPVKELIPADPVLKSDYPSSMDERNEAPASENGDETYLLDDTDSLSPLLDETGLEQVSATGDDHLLQADGSSPFQPVFLTNRGRPVKELTPADPVLESGYPSSTDERNEPPASENGDKTYLLDDTDKLHKYEKICSMTIKSPFSTFVEIDDFLHPPIFGSTVQNSAEFLDLNNKQTPQSSTKLFHTTTYYPEQPYGHLVCSKIHEMLFFTDTVHTYGLNQKNNHYESIVVPVHGSPFAKIEETNNKSYASHDFIQIRAPVVVGEYKVEICLEDGVVFEEEITRVKEISKEVVLTTCKFVPTQFSPSLDNGICSALKGMLFIEGYIRQNIEYTAASNRNAEQKEPATHLRQLHQKIVLDLIIHLLQVQQVLLSYDGNGI